MKRPSYLLLFGITIVALSIGIQAPVKAVTANFDYWASLCPLLRDQHKYEAALAACDQAISLKQKKADVWAVRSDILLNLEKYEEALTSAVTALQLKPRHSLALTYQCGALSELGKQEEALAACNQALQFNRDWGYISPAQAWYNRGLALSRSQRYEDAIAAFSSAVKLKSNYSLALTQQCKALTASGKYEAAVTACERALQVNGDWGNKSPALAWYIQGVALSRLGQYKEAFSKCHPTPVNSLSSTSSTDATRECVKQERLSKIEAAIAAYDRSTGLDPNDATAWTNQGVLLNELGRYAQARTSHAAAIKISPNYALALANQCATLNKLSIYQEALAACDHALQGDGRWDEIGPAYAWMQRSQVLSGLAQYEEALNSVSRAIALKPDYAEAWNTQSVILWSLERYKEALSASDRALALNPDYFQGWFNRGRILRTLKQNEAAIAAYDRTLHSEVSLIAQSTLADVWANRSAALWNLGKYQEALNSANSATNIDPSSIQGWLNRAVALESLNHDEDAIVAYGRALRINPKSAAVLSSQAMALLRLKRYKEALTTFEEVLKVDPTYPQAQQNRDALLLLKPKQVTIPNFQSPNLQLSGY